MKNVGVLWIALVCGVAGVVSGQITNWQTGEVIPGTESITPGPGLILANWNSQTQSLKFADLSGGLDLRSCVFKWSWLSHAHFMGANLTKANFTGALLIDTDLSGADLTDGFFNSARLADADFTDAIIRGTAFWSTTKGGFTKEQLYSTASYKSKDLTGVGLVNDNMSDWNLAGQNLTNASFMEAVLTNVDLSGANVTGADFTGALLTNVNFADAIIKGAHFILTNGFTKEQLYSTASYKSGDLEGIGLWSDDLSQWDLAGQNLASADFRGATLTNVNLADAIIKGANFHDTTDSGFTKEQLYSTADYKSGDLEGIGLSANDLSQWDLAGQNLASAHFFNATLTNVNFADAIIKGADFGHTTDSGFTKEQLYSTADYKSGDLEGIGLRYNDLSQWDLAGQNLASANFQYTTLTGADLSGANLANANFYEAVLTNMNVSMADMRNAEPWWRWPSDPLLHNTIEADGHIRGLHLNEDEVLPVRDYAGDLAITVDDRMIVEAGSTIRVIFEDASWGSTISVAGGIVPELGGTLELTFVEGADVLSLVGTTYDLFNWNGLLPAEERFDEIVLTDGCRWDVSRLYTTGEVTLVVPEPSTLVLLGLAALGVRIRRR